MIVMLGERGCRQLQRLQIGLRQRHVPAIILDPLAQPPAFRLSWYPLAQQGMLHINGQDIHYRDIKAVYWHIPYHQTNFASLPPPLYLNLINTLYLSPEFQWVNPLQCMHFRANTAHNLTVAARLGAKLPPTYIGNQAGEIRQFYENHNHRVKVIKQLDNHANAEYASPIMIQAYDKAACIRSFVIGHQVFSFIYQEEGAVVKHAELVTISSEHEHLCRRICRGFNMYWCAIEWVMTRNHEYLFVEADPSPDFVQFTDLCNTPMDERVMELLTQFC